MNPAWFLLLAPLLSAVLTLVWLRTKPLGAILVSVAACATAFLVAIGFFTGSLAAPVPLNWIDVGTLHIQIGMQIDPLSKLMLLVVSGVGLLIHIFSIGYMAEDPGRARFFAKLSLFMFSMLGIVVADNLVMMFIFWELVGLSSYLLVGFWFERDSAADAAKKAFIVNKIGDFGFLLGILWFWAVAGTVAFAPEAAAKLAGSPSITVIALLLFCGCVGKSAMVPLHVWLPDAMEGPTPVSALIHAATMVAAGVYMLCRIYYVLELSPVALEIIACIGGGTALFAALIATQQNDIKRILAYSTLSQLGYMVMAVGCGGPGAAMFHLTTHAFFKALLFLAAGSVIHAMHHEQDIWKMGGLRHKVPVTFWTFLIGTLALSGFPGLAGFFSKDEILLTALNNGHEVLFLMAVTTAGLTTFYMLRLVFVAFFGGARSEAAKHAHESPAVMTVPLVILAVLAVIGGYSFFGIREYLHELGPETPHGYAHSVVALSLTAFLTGLFASFYLYFYRRAAVDPVSIPLFANKFYFDEFYDRGLVRFQQAVARIVAWIDNWILGVGMVRGVAAGANLGGEILRLFQAGNLQGYAFLFSFGATLILYFVLIR